MGVGCTLQVIALRHAHPADAAIILSTETVIAALVGAAPMGDRLSLTGLAGLAGCALILACMLSVQVLP